MARLRKKPTEKLAPVADEVLDQFGPAAGMSMEDINAATRRLKKALMERMLGGELSHHLGYAPGGDKPDDTPNHRNGASAKTVVTDDGPVAIAVPRDRAGTFAPVLVPSMPAGWRALTTKSWRSMRAACRRGRSRSFSRRSMRSRYRRISSARSPTRSWPR